MKTLETPWRLALKAEAAIRARRFADAKKSLDAALKLSRRAPWVYLLLYRFKRVAGLKGALRDLDTAFRADPACAWVFGLAPLPAGAPAEAVALQELLKTFSTEQACGGVFAYRGQARAFRGDGPGGLADLETAARLEPVGWIHAWLGESYRKAGRTAEALAALDTALRLDPKYANAYGWRATLRLAAGDAERALMDLESALRLQPTARGHMDRARALRTLGRVADSLGALEAAVLLNPELAWGSIDPAGLERSLVEIRAALAGLPNEGRLYAWEGETLLRLGRPAEALAVLERATAKAPRFGLGRAWKAQALASLRRNAEAHKELAVARRLADGYAPAHLLAGVLDLQAGKADKALRPLTRAIKSAPYSARLYLARAGALVRLDRRAAARRDLDHCLRLCPGFADALRLRAAIDGRSVEKVPSLDVADAVLTP